MRKTHLLLLLALMLISSMSLYAINDNEAATVNQINVLESTATSTTIEFALPEFKIVSEDANGMTFNKVDTRCDGFIPVEGMPELPVFSTMIAIPNNGSVSLEVLDRNSYRIDNFTAYPAQDYTVENESDRSFSMNAEFYNSSVSYPLETEKISEPIIVRDFRVVSLTFSPFTYNPATRSLDVAQNITYRLNYSSEESINEIETPQMYSPSFEPLYRSLIANYDAVVDRGIPVHNKRLLIIYGGSTDAQYLAKLDELIQWKKQKGYKVSSASTTDIGNSTAEVKAYIQSKYNNIYTRPEYVLLIGDTSGSLSIDCWTVGGGSSDYPYTQLAGTDTMGDVFIGRMPAETITHFLTMANKVFIYERDTIPAPPSWYNSMLLVGDPSHSGQSAIYVNKFMKYTSLNVNPNYTFTELTGNASAMTAAINAGVSFFVYRGYIGMSGWDMPNEGSFTNANKMPHCIVNTCATGSFNGTDVSDAFVRFGTPALPKGAITAIGMATASTHTLMNNVLTSQTVDGIFNWGYRNMSAPLLQSKLLLYMIYHDFLPQYAINFPGWCNLMGDPTVEVFIGTPQAIVANYPDSVLPGQTCFPVHAQETNGDPMVGAVVTLVNDNMQLIMETDLNGNAIFELPDDLVDSDDFIVTISEHDHIPVYETIEVQVSDGIAVSSVTFDDATGGNNNGNPDAGEIVNINLTLTNPGAVDLTGVVVEMSSSNPYVTVVQNSATFGDIAMGADATGDVAYQISIAGNIPEEYKAALTLDVVGENYTTYLGLELENASIVIDGYQLFDANGILEPGETTWLSLSLLNNGPHGITGLHAELSSESNLVYFEDSEAFYGNAMPGSTVTNITDGLSISTRSQLLVGPDVEVIVHLFNDAGYDDYQKLYIPTGSANLGSPTGPDNFGHYIYHSDDTSWPDAPVYNWIGIAPAEGGSGTEFTSISDSGTDGGDGDVDYADTIDNTDLPFTFTFFGRDYDEVYICSNGFMTFVPTELGTFRNYPLPGPMSPEPCIAPFWDDMYYTGNAGIYHWYDSVNHLFIIEWYDATCGFSPSHSQQFQVILYDPEYYPTSTGDGMVKIQYHTFNDVDAGDTSSYPPLTGQYSTVGFSDHVGTDGIQYVFDQDYGPTSQQIQDGVALLITGEPYLNVDPALAFSALEIDEANGNGFIEPGEFVELTFSIVNNGMDDAENVVASISSTDMNIGFITDTTVFELIPGNDGLGMNGTPFTAMISPTATEGLEIPISLTLATIDQTWEIDASIMVTSPQISVLDPMICDAEAGNSNGIIEQNELVSLVLNLSNPSQANIENVQIAVSTSNPNISITGDTTLPYIPANGALQAVYVMNVLTAVPDNTIVDFDVEIQAAGTLTTNETVSVTVGAASAIPAGGVIMGTVTVDQGTPEMSDVIVNANNYARFVASDGAYRVYVPYGMHDVSANLEHYAQDTVTDISITSGTPISAAELVLEYLAEATALSGTFDERELTLMWTAPTNDFTVTAYNIYQKINNGEYMMVGTSTTESYIHDVVGDGEFFYYVVTEYAEGVSIPSIVYSFDTATGNMNEDSNPLVTELYGNFPNPFNPVTNIAYSLAVEDVVTINIYNIRGQLVKSLVNEVQSVGKHVIQWDGTDNNNNNSASGLYMYRFQTKGVNVIKKAMLLK